MVRSKNTRFWEIKKISKKKNPKNFAFRIPVPPRGWGGGGPEIIGIWVKCFNFYRYLVPYVYAL